MCAMLKIVKDKIKVSKNHNCYHQIQGQLLLSGLDFCDFVLYTRKDLYTERVDRDVKFINAMISKLHDLYVGLFKVCCTSFLEIDDSVLLPLRHCLCLAFCFFYCLCPAYCFVLLVSRRVSE